MIDELLKAFSPSLREIRSQQSRQYIQIKTGFQLIKQLVISEKLPCKQDIIDLTSRLDTTQPKDIETEIRNLVKNLRVEVDRIKQNSVEIKKEIDEKLQKMEILLEEVKKLSNGE